MDDNSHNLLQSYYNDGDCKYHYDSLQYNGNTFYVGFTRAITGGGIYITVGPITGNNGYKPTSDDVTALANIVTGFQNKPLNGNECVALGWTYLGHTSSNLPRITAAIAAAKTNGWTFESLFYHSGYFVHGCAGAKQFYDQNT
jgi:hypothetical protein